MPTRKPTVKPPASLAKLGTPAPRIASEQTSDSDLVRSALRKILLDDDCPAAARATAAKTLAEMLGLVGRHQDKPDNTAGKALSSLSREDLLAEMARLRAIPH